ncbi:putative RNA-binding protein RbpF [Planktothrix serta PCC 8927]|uniref:RNA-binding protein RbpF n=1 Tax=Planktothrix serta PCC 8927 TaxID=671068 RepID=A0A7Z9C4S6_9CYAN|nr:RNA-binding protein [Planktothrix serta]VXD25858.1 putative RNA-binding protein RbpF [Planktothrix serta PCC 8927]
MSIYVGNLSYEVTQEDLTSVFAEYGSVKRVQLPKDRETGRVRGFAFVEMETEAEEEKAIDDLDGAEWMGRSMKVNKAKPRENSRGDNSFGGAGGGARGGGNRRGRY